MQQEQKTKKKSDSEDIPPDVNLHGVKTDSDIEDILDEIDNVLEENAEEFVAGFIQKGGE